MPVAAVRFGDTLISFLEWLALAGAASADVAVDLDAARPVVEIRPTGWTPDASARHDLQALRLAWFDHVFKGAP